MIRFGWPRWGLAGRLVDYPVKDLLTRVATTLRAKMLANRFLDFSGSHGIVLHVPGLESRHSGHWLEQRVSPQPDDQDRVTLRRVGGFLS